MAIASGAGPAAEAAPATPTPRRLIFQSSEVGCSLCSPATARAACARYLDKRIQSTASQKPGREPDMSEDAGAAFKAVLVEVASVLLRLLIVLEYQQHHLFDKLHLQNLLLVNQELSLRLYYLMLI